MNLIGLFLYDHSSITHFGEDLFSIGSFSIKKYAVCILIGALIALIVGIRWGRRIGIKEDDIYTAFGFGLVIGVLGARIFYCVFDDFHKVITKPWTIITEFRNGGLAISGGIIAGGIFEYFYCKKIKVHPLFFGELAAPGFFIGQACGRWGNFFNHEAHGTLVPGFPDLDAQRSWLSSFLPKFIVDNMYIYETNSAATEIGYYHPTFLYESFFNLIGLGVILLLRKFYKKYLIGDAVFIYFAWYGTLRFFIEFIRTDAQYIGNTGIKVAQVVAITLFIIGVAGYILRHAFNYKPVLWSNPEGVANSFGIKKDDTKNEEKTEKIDTSVEDVNTTNEESSEIVNEKKDEE